MIEPTFVNNYDDTYTVSNICSCGHTTTANVPAPSVFRWRQGAFVQIAFPNLTADEREALFVSGICADCWNDMFPPEDDNYIGDDYYSGTGELIGDESYINYLNNS